MQASQGTRAEDEERQRRLIQRVLPYLRRHADAWKTRDPETKE